MKAGSYRLTVGLNSTDLINILQLGQPEELFRVTIPEGWTARKMAAKLEELEIVTAASFLAATRDPAVLAPFQLAATSAEGYLFPDTYYWPKDFEAAQLVQIMVENFFSRLDSLELPALPSGAQLQQKLILASILEREYRLAEEAPLIASVFYNRLRQGQRLESCATVLYVLTEEIGRPHPTRILFSDLEIPSSYNTYLNPGLPPGPISNPGLVALRAALQPAASDYFFFVVKDPARGSHTFTRSLTDHNQARARYLETFLR